MTLERKGSCNGCGKCCQYPVMVENPCIDRGEKFCKFYTSLSTGKLYGHCLIYEIGLENIEKARDNKGNPITKEQIRWFNENCIEYPKAKDAEIGVYLPPECSYAFEVSEGVKSG